MSKTYYVYILTTRKNTVLYTGITSDLGRRVYEHQNGLNRGFTKKYNVNKLVYAKRFSDVEIAIHREKCIKEWKRNWKIGLIEKANPDWLDLSNQYFP
jgi:putative endonuclease